MESAMVEEIGSLRRSFKWSIIGLLVVAFSTQIVLVWAQQPQSSKTAESDPFILGPLTSVKAYTSTEVLSWGKDFIFSPTEARDRVVLYAYDFSAVDEAFFHQIQSQLLEEHPKLAVVSRLPKKMLRFSGKETGFRGVPIIVDGRNEAIVRNFVQSLDNLESYERVVPAIMTLAALKTIGIDPDYFSPDWKAITYDHRWSGQIATSIPVKGYKHVIYLASSTGWDASQNPAEAMARLSEITDKISKVSFRY
jgi:hypothetical protein